MSIQLDRHFVNSFEALRSAIMGFAFFAAIMLIYVLTVLHEIRDEIRKVSDETRIQ